LTLGQWKDKIIIQKSTAGNDATGNHKLIWEDYYRCSTLANNLSGREYWEAAQINEEKELYFLIRYCSETACMDSEHYRILFRNQIYNITFIDNRFYQNRMLKIRASVVKR